MTCLCFFMLVCYISVSEMFGLLPPLQASATAANALCDQGTPFRSTLLWDYAPLCWCGLNATRVLSPLQPFFNRERSSLFIENKLKP